MIRQYFKQAFQMLKETPLISTISICGTALSICMILIIFLSFQVRMANYAPENARDRMLYVGQAATYNTSDKQKSAQGGMSVEMVKACFYSLKTPVAVSATATLTTPVSIPGKRMFKPFKIQYTDTGFWNLFSFDFLSGQSFTEADFVSAIPRAVISESTARRIYGTTDAVGKSLIVYYTEYTICGVVKDVSQAASSAFSEIWVPYTTQEELLRGFGNENIMGAFAVRLLAGDKADFPTIRSELNALIAAYNSTKSEQEVRLPYGPVTQLDILVGSGSSGESGKQGFWLETGLLLLFLILVPALNLSGVTQSAVQKRRAEIGVRKAFGATSGVLLKQILCESCLTTFIGGAIGLALAFPLFWLSKDFLLSMDDVALNAEMLFRSGVFLAAFFFCLLLNLLSAGLPAMRIAKLEVIDSLKDEVK